MPVKRRAVASPAQHRRDALLHRTHEEAVARKRPASARAGGPRRVRVGREGVASRCWLRRRRDDAQKNGIERNHRRRQSDHAGAIDATCVRHHRLFGACAAVAHAVHRHIGIHADCWHVHAARPDNTGGHPGGQSDREQNGQQATCSFSPHAYRKYQLPMSDASAAAQISCAHRARFRHLAEGHGRTPTSAFMPAPSARRLIRRCIAPTVEAVLRAGLWRFGYIFVASRCNRDPLSREYQEASLSCRRPKPS